MATVEDLKARFAESARQRARVLATFRTFMEEFETELCRFLARLVEEGIPGVEPCHELSSTDDLREVSFKANELELVLCVPNQCNPLDFDKPWAAKAFFYVDGSDVGPPFASVVVSDIPGETALGYWLTWFPRVHEEQISARIEVEEGSGAVAAQILLDHLFDFAFRWEERPVRRAFHRGSSERAIDFKR